MCELVFRIRVMISVVCGIGEPVEETTDKIIDSESGIVVDEVKTYDMF